MPITARKLVLALAASALVLDAALAVDNITLTSPPDLAAIRAKIKAKDFPGAVADLRALADNVQHADVYSLLGFSLRKTGNYAEARTFYAKALDFDPAHLGAHEYLGELYVETGEMDKARAMLAKLEQLCPKGCEELDDLRKAVTAAAKTN